MSDDLDFLPAAPNQGKPAEAGDAAKPKTQGSTSADEPPGSRAELPTWNRSRRKRKANVKAEALDDAFQRGVRQASRQVIDAPKLMLGALVILIAGIAGGVAIHNHKMAANAEASRTLQTATAAIVRGQVVPEEQLAELGEAIRFYRIPIFSSEEEREATVADALTAARESGRKGVEQNATLVAAALAMRNADFDTALREYDNFLAASDDDHPLRFLALEGKGHALEAMGEYEAALEAFVAIAPSPLDFHRQMALYHQGRVLEALDRKDEALAIYEQFFHEFPPTREEMATPLVRARAEKLDPDFSSRLRASESSPLPTP